MFLKKFLNMLYHNVCNFWPKAIYYTWCIIMVIVLSYCHQIKKLENIFISLRWCYFTFYKNIPPTKLAQGEKCFFSILSESHLE